MSAFGWIIVALAAIIGGYIIDYQKNKLKWQDKSSKTAEDVDEIRTLVHQMKKRIENLEAIAASDPEEFKSKASDPLGRIEMDRDDQIKNENQQKVSNLAKEKGD